MRIETFMKLMLILGVLLIVSTFLGECQGHPDKNDDSARVVVVR